MKCITGWITHAFWLVFTHDLLEERRIDDVTSNTFFLLDCMKQMSSMLPCVFPEIDYRRQNVVTLVCASWATFLFSQNLEVICDPQLNRRTAWNLFVNPLHPNISMHILHTVLNTFPKVLTRRICLTIYSFYCWWSFPFFLWPFCVIWGWYCKEKLDASHSQGFNG